jgi:hypothetical protein
MCADERDIFFIMQPIPYLQDIKDMQNAKKDARLLFKEQVSEPTLMRYGNLILGGLASSCHIIIVFITNVITLSYSRTADFPLEYIFRNLVWSSNINLL